MLRSAAYLLCACFVADAATVSARAQQASVPSYRSPSCDALCDLVTAITTQLPGSLEVPAPARASSGKPMILPQPAPISRKIVAQPKPLAERASAVARPATATRPAAPVDAESVKIAVGSAEKPFAQAVIAVLGRHRLTATTRPADPDSGGPRPAQTDLSIVAVPLIDKKADAGIVTILGSEDLHLLAGPDIKTMEDLRGHSVSFGLNGGAAQVVARALLRARNIGVTEVPLDADNAIDALRLGSVAAVVILASKPDSDLADLPKTSGFHLLSLGEGDAPADLEGVRTATMVPADYPALLGSDSIRTLAVDVALVANGGPRSRVTAARLKPFFAPEASAGQPRLASRSPAGLK